MKPVLKKAKYSMGLNFFLLLQSDLKARRKVRDIEFRFDEMNKILICKLIRGSLTEAIIERLVFEGHPDGPVSRTIDIQIEVKGCAAGVAMAYEAVKLEASEQANQATNKFRWF